MLYSSNICFIILLALTFSMKYSYRFPLNPKKFEYRMIPKDILFEPSNVELVRLLGNIDLSMDRDNYDQLKREIIALNDEDLLEKFLKQPSPQGTQEIRLTSVRIFEAVLPGGNRCYIKEYLPAGTIYGKNEFAITKKLTSKYNTMLEEKNKSNIIPPFPILFGHLKTDNRIENPEFKARWIKRFPRTSPPSKGNLWLLFRWDEASFKSLKNFPSIPQIIDASEYFNKEVRDEKRWRFVRKIMKKVLEALEFFHRSGYSHNSISSESIWLTTNNQLEIETLEARIADLGTSKSFKELGPFARETAMEDLYQLGFVYLQLVLCGFSEDTSGAAAVRGIISGKLNNIFWDNIVNENPEVYRSQVSCRELQTLFETVCNSDFQSFRDILSAIKPLEESLKMLECDNGACWKLIFRLLARGKLVDPVNNLPLKITCYSLIRDNIKLFEDI